MTSFALQFFDCFSNMKHQRLSDYIYFSKGLSVLSQLASHCWMLNSNSDKSVCSSSMFCLRRGNQTHLGCTKTLLELILFRALANISNLSLHPKKYITTHTLTEEEIFNFQLMERFREARMEKTVGYLAYQATWSQMYHQPLAFDIGSPIKHSIYLSMHD